MVLKIFFPQCCNLADSGLLVGRWIPGHDSAVVLAVIHYPFIPAQVKQYIQQVGRQSGEELTVLGSWSLPKEGQEGMESFLRDLSTIFPQERWLQISRKMDGGPQPAALPPGPVRRRAAEVDPLADGGPGGQHPGGAAEAGVGAALPAPQ
uniref:Phosphatidylinositol N-acetylglucosaminyltransferase subunit Q n=1 Tax=Oryzias sinensis TaxID=183150 RepID=A0A8C7XWQ4_9TELE